MFTPLAFLRLTLAGLALSASVMGCATGSILPEASSGGVGGSTSSTGGGEPVLTGAGGAGGGSQSWNGFPSSGQACSAPTQYVYLVDTESGFWRFWPPTLEMTRMGTLSCPDESGGGPYSMAVDRQGKAWILYRNGTIFELDIASGHCEPTGYIWPGVTGTFSTFGMAFTADAASPAKETLFVRDAVPYEQGFEPSSRPVGRLDVEGKLITMVGENPGGPADLAGTGDGRLFAFRKDSEASAALAEINPATGENLAVTNLAGVTIGTSWAVALWGGDVWMFSDQQPASSSIVRHQLGTGTTTIVKTDIGPHIIGAGVSSCAPVAPPK